MNRFIATTLTVAALATVPTIVSAQDFLEPGDSPACAQNKEGCFAFYVFDAPTPISETHFVGQLANFATSNGYEGISPQTMLQPGKYMVRSADEAA